MMDCPAVNAFFELIFYGQRLTKSISVLIRFDPQHGKEILISMNSQKNEINWLTYPQNLQDQVNNPQIRSQSFSTRSIRILTEH